MNEEPNPELLNRQPRCFKPSAKWCINVTIIFWLIVVPLLLLIAPMFIGSRHNSHIALSNAKLIGIALFEFENKYKSYPNASTAKQVTSDFPTHGHSLTGKSSNAALRQLIAAGLCTSEDIFYSEMNGKKRPNGNMNPGEALKKGEVGFAYISGLTKDCDPSTPILCAPLIPGTKKFDPKPFDGRAIILKLDQSATTLKIRSDGTVFLGGKDLFSDDNPIWNGKAPDIRYPE